MSKQIVQNKLSEIVTEQTRSSQMTADTFISLLFAEIEKELISNSFIRLEGIGLLRIIKSGENKRILYLSSNTRIPDKIDLSGIDTETNTGDRINLTRRNNSENISFDSEYHNDKPASELFETFEEKYPQNENIPIPGSNRKLKEKEISQSQNDYTYIANRKMNLIKTCIIALAILLLVSIGYIAVSGASAKPDETELRETGFREIENTDTLAFNRIIVPQVDVSIQYIARIYYGDDIYWPYIFMANKDATNKNMVIRGGTKIRVPRIAVDLAGLHDGTVQNSVKSLAKDIILVENK